jgi:hypothetical protein
LAARRPRAPISISAAVAGGAGVAAPAALAFTTATAPTFSSGMARRWLRERAKRRAHAREQGKLARDLERLAGLQPGGAPDRPIRVTSPAQVDVIGERKTCPHCRIALRLEQHVAATVDGVRLRVAQMRCPGCGTKRSLYFRLEQRFLH